MFEDETVGRRFRSRFHTRKWSEHIRMTAASILKGCEVTGREDDVSPKSGYQSHISRLLGSEQLEAVPELI